MFVSQVKKILPHLMEARITPLLVGHKGVGKTELIRQFAKEYGFTDVVDIKLGNLQDPADLLGIMEFFKDPTGKTRSVYARPIFWPTDPEAKVLIFFDELNRANRQLVQPIMELSLEGKHLDYILPKNCRVVAAMNPATNDYLVNDISDSALLDRFCQIKVTFDSEELYSYLTSVKQVDPYLAQFVKERASLVSPNMTDFSLEVTCSPRKMDMFLNRILPQNPSSDALIAIGHGWLGVETTSALLNWIDQAPVAIKGSEVLSSFSKDAALQKRYESMFKDGQQRIDMFIATIDDLISTILTKKKLTKKEFENIYTMCSMTPPEPLKTFFQKVLEAERRNSTDTPNISVEGIKALREEIESDAWNDLVDKISAYNKKLKAASTL